MSGANRGTIVGALAVLSMVAAAVVAIYVAWPASRHAAPAPGETAEPAPPPPSSSSPLRGAPTPSPGAPQPVAGVPQLRQDPLSPHRAQPYRPAHPLRYSEGVPSASPTDDDHSPTLLRLLAVTQATPAQEARIRQAWRAHEDGRRALLAEAHPPSIGLPVLDPQRLLELDRAFDETVMAQTLDFTQRQRLLLELGPNKIPPPEPPAEP